MFLRLFSVAALCAIMAACAPTGYQSADQSVRGGYHEEKISENVYLVSARGNGYTDNQRLQKIILLRAANLTHSNGFSHFEVMLGTGVFANVNQEMLSPLMAFRGGGSFGGFRGGGFVYRPVATPTFHTRTYSYPVYYGGYSSNVYLPTGSLVIRMINGAKGSKGLPAFDAKKVIAKLTPQVATPAAQ